MRRAPARPVAARPGGGPTATTQGSEQTSVVPPAVASGECKRCINTRAGSQCRCGLYRRPGKSQANYAAVSSGSTGHAEAVQITYDPRQITLGDILQIFFSIAHDPTERNRQGPDVGTQYRSAVFYADNAQRDVALAYIAQR